ncbi:MAG: LemA family protein [Bacteroidales bacterium]|nr:LemA family protein [Bacteroidales bacterium]
MKKGTVTLIVVAVAAIALFAWVKGAYNRMVSSEEGVGAAWAQVENVYQRRADLIPNLVATVKGYAEHESSTLESVIAARARAAQITVSPDNLDEASIAEYGKAQGELTSALGRLMAVAESYPDLKANSVFSELQAQLEGTENRIATERMKFNEAARTYNTMIRKFPDNILASMFGFERKGYFEAQDGADKAPVVAF